MDDKMEKKPLSLIDKIRAAVTNLRRPSADQKLLECLPNLPTIYDVDEGGTETINSTGQHNRASCKTTHTQANATRTQVLLKESTKKPKHKSSRSKKSEDSAPSCSTSNASSATDITENCTAKHANSTRSKRSDKKETSQSSSGKESTKRDSNKSNRKQGNRKKEETYIEHESAPVGISGAKTKSNSRKHGGPSSSFHKHLTVKEYIQDKSPGSASSDAYSSAKSTLSKHSMPSSSPRSKKHKQRGQSTGSSSSQQSSSNSHKMPEQKEQFNKRQSKSKFTSMKVFPKKSQSHNRQLELSSHLENIEEAVNQPPPEEITNTGTLVVVSSTDALNKAPQHLNGIKRSGTSNTIRSTINKKKSSELNEVTKKNAGLARQNSNLAMNMSTQPRHISKEPTTVSPQRSTRPSNQPFKTTQGRQPFNNKVISQNMQTSYKPPLVSSKPSQVKRSKDPPQPKTEHPITSTVTSKEKSNESTKNIIPTGNTKDILCIFTNTQEKNFRKTQFKEKIPNIPKLNKDSSSSSFKCLNQSNSVLLREYNYDDFLVSSEYLNKNDKPIPRNVSPTSGITSSQTTSECISNIFSQHQLQEEAQVCEIKEHYSTHTEVQSTEESSSSLAAEETKRYRAKGQNISETSRPTSQDIPQQSRLSKGMSLCDSKYTNRSNNFALTQKRSRPRPKTSHELNSSRVASPTTSKINNHNRENSQLVQTTSPIRFKSRTQDPINNVFSKCNSHGNTSKTSVTNRRSFQIRPNTSQVVDNCRFKLGNENILNNDRYASDQHKRFDSSNINNSQTRPHTSQSIRKFRTQQLVAQSKFNTNNSVSEQRSSCSTRKPNRKQSWKDRPSTAQHVTKSKTHPPSQTASTYDLKSSKSSLDVDPNGQTIQGQSAMCQINEDSRTRHPSCSTRKNSSSQCVKPVEETKMIAPNRFQEKTDNFPRFNNITEGLNLLSASALSTKLPMRNPSQLETKGRPMSSWNTIMEGNTPCYSTTMKQSKLSNTNCNDISRVLFCADTSKQEYVVRSAITEPQSNMGLTSYPVSGLDSDEMCDSSPFVRPSTSFPCTKAEATRYLTQDGRLLSDKTSVPFPLIRDRTYLILPSGPDDTNMNVVVGNSGVPILTRQNTYLVFPTKDEGGQANIEVLHKTSNSVPAITVKTSANQVDNAASANPSEIPLQKETTYLVLSARAATNSEEADDGEAIPLEKKSTFMIFPNESSSTETVPERSASEIRLIRTTTYEVIPSAQVYSNTEN